MIKTLNSQHGDAIAAALIKLRKQSGLSQRELAKRLGREHSFVGLCELGQRRVDLAEFYWICLCCDASPQQAAVELMWAFSALPVIGIKLD